MNRILALTALMALPLTACQTMAPPVQVTRFHVPEAPVTGTISVEPMEGVDAGIEYRTYATAVEQAASRVGFTPLGGGNEHGAYIIRLSVRSDIRPGGPRPRPVSGVVGGSTGSYGSGVGIGININLSGRPKDVSTTELSVRIVDREGRVVWEGRAQMEAKQGTPAAQPGIAAAKLADALFRGYPGRSGETITVE